MHYAIITYGSRGDVQPYIALALGLMEKGHEVVLLANENFNELVEGYGIHCFPLHGDIEAIMHSPEMLVLLKTGNMVTFLRETQKIGSKDQPLVNEGILKGCAGADVLIASPLTMIWVYSIAEKLKKKWAVVQLSVPATPTREFPFAGFAFFNVRWLNIFTHRLARYIYWELNKKDVWKHRKSLGLPPLKKPMLKEIDGQKILMLYAFSPMLIPRPKDWQRNIDITGFLFTPQKRSYVPSPDLLAWLQAGDAPIYVGFGSIPIPDPELFARILYKVVEQTNCRIIFCQGWSEMADMPTDKRIFIMKYADHSWLLPRCKAAIIHGGIGTIAAVLKAKIPMIILSIFADQPLWGKIIADKNLGVHIPFKKLTAEKLLAAIKKTQTTEMQKNASDTGDIINKEDGIRKAISALENY